MSSLTKELQILFGQIERRARLLQDLGKLSKAPQRHQVVSIGDSTLARLLDYILQEQREQLRAAIQQGYGDEREANEALLVQFDPREEWKCDRSRR